MRKRLWKRSLAAVTSLALAATAVFSGFGDGATAVQAATQMGKGSLATEVTGSYSWDSGSASNASLLAKLPTIANKGTHRFTTDRYDAENGAFDTSN